MRHLHYIEIENFKCFGERQRIELHHPTVLIGPNDSGKTTVLEALMLWQYGIESLWYHDAGADRWELYAASILSREFCQAIPGDGVEEFFHGKNLVDEEGVMAVLKVEVGVEYGGEVSSIPLRFTAIPNIENLNVSIEAGSLVNRNEADALFRLKASIAHPMSAIDPLEPYLKPNRVRALSHHGNTGAILRNLALQVYDTSVDESGRVILPESPWVKVQQWMQRLFRIQLVKPTENPGTGLLSLNYETSDETRLEISTTGRGCRQFLYLLLTIYSGEVSVLLLDEPDAHLEILRQRQILFVLEELAREQGVQLIYTSHSEAVFDDSLSGHVVLLADGRVVPDPDKQMVRSALEFHGGQHYLKARMAGHILYLEQYTDLRMLTAIAKRLEHPLYDALAGLTPPNVYYTRDPDQFDPDLDDRMEKLEEGYGLSARKHFHGLEPLIPGLQGMLLRDRNEKTPPESLEGPFQMRVWGRYELENYFITPEGLARAAMEAGIEAALAEESFLTLLEERVIKQEAVRKIYREQDTEGRRGLWADTSGGVKLSAFAEEYFRRIHQETGQPMILRKADLHELIPHAELFDTDELTEKLDAIHVLLTENRIEARMEKERQAIKESQLHPTQPNETHHDR